MFYDLKKIIFSMRIVLTFEGFNIFFCKVYVEKT